MKKLITTLLLTTIISTMSPVTSTKAATPLSNTQTTITQLGNGYYAETTIEQPAELQNQNGIALLSTSKRITRTKTTILKNATGTVLWSLSITATFSYNGTSSSCISCSHNTKVSHKSWSIKKATSSKRGNTATAIATAKCINKEQSACVTISCDKNGKVS